LGLGFEADRKRAQSGVSWHRSTAIGGFLRKIAAGQRYRKTAPPSTVWEVLETVLESGGTRHFWLSNIDDPTTIKLISELTLANHRLYRLINER
jgi:hypothetical protein